MFAVCLAINPSKGNAGSLIIYSIIGIIVAIMDALIFMIVYGLFYWFLYVGIILQFLAIVASLKYKPT